jgi:predicted kinase
MKLNEIAQPDDKPIILVYGKLCSGKGTFCGNYTDYVKIVTSDVVRQVSGETKRSGLGKTAHLDTAIAAELKKQISHQINNGNKVIVDGIRQKSIVSHILQQFGEDNVEQIWLEVPNDELKRRFNSRGADKDDQEFEKSYKQDEELGLGELEPWLKSNPKVKQVNHS